MTSLPRSCTVLLFAGLLAAPLAYADSTYLDNSPSAQPFNNPMPNRSYGQKTGDKALNAVANIGVGFWELPKNIINTTNDSNIFYGLTGGLFKGILNTVGRLSVGAVDLVTAPIPTKPVTYPKYAWQNTKVDTTYGNIFELDLSGKPVPAAALPAPPQTAAPVAVAPRLPAVDASDPYQQQTNKKIDAYFKKQMMK